MNRTRVLHGLSEVAGQGIYSVLGINHNGGSAEMVVWEQNSSGYPCSGRNLKIDKRKKIFYPFYALKASLFLFYAMFRYSIFHFHYGRSILVNHDLKLLRLFRKKIIYEFHGSDLRNMKTHAQADPYSYCNDYCKNYFHPFKRYNKIFQYAHAIVLHDDELLVDIPAEFHDKTYIVPLRCDFSQLMTALPDKKEHQKLQIVHAPSNTRVKGTSDIERAIGKLKEKYELEYIRIEKMEHSQAVQLYANADIIVDQLRIGTYGVFAIEAMGLGKPVITYINDYMKTRLPADCPIQSANVDSIEEVLEDLIKDREKRDRLGKAGREYVRKYHDMNVIGARLLEIYEGEAPALKGREAFLEVAKIYEKKNNKI